MDYKKLGASGILLVIISGGAMEVRSQVKDIYSRVIILETKDNSKEQRFLRYMNRIDKTLNKIEDKVDKIIEGSL